MEFVKKEEFKEFFENQNKILRESLEEFNKVFVETINRIDRKEESDKLILPDRLRDFIVKEDKNNKYSLFSENLTLDQEVIKFIDRVYSIQAAKSEFINRVTKEVYPVGIGTSRINIPVIPTNSVGEILTDTNTNPTNRNDLISHIAVDIKPAVARTIIRREYLHLTPYKVDQVVANLFKNVLTNTIEKYLVDKVVNNTNINKITVTEADFKANIVDIMTDLTTSINLADQDRAVVVPSKLAYKDLISVKDSTGAPLAVATMQEGIKTWTGHEIVRTDFLSDGDKGRIIFGNLENLLLVTSNYEFAIQDAPAAFGIELLAYAYIGAEVIDTNSFAVLEITS